MNSISQGTSAPSRRRTIASVAFTAWRLLPWRRKVLYVLWFLLMLYSVLGYFQLVTPVSELPEILPAVASNLFAGAPRPQPCAPCGCDGQRTASADVFCIRDEELTFLSSLDVPLHPRASLDAALHARSFLADRLDTRQCYEAVRHMHMALHRDGGAADASEAPYARGHVLWHWYVRLDTSSDLTKAQADMLAAWLATQDVHRGTVVVWVPMGKQPPPAVVKYAQLFPGSIRWRQLDVPWLAEGTPLARSYLLRLKDERAWADSDIARLVILWRYGGVWSDTDMLFVHDLSPLLGLQFATEFSCDHGQAGFNNAIMRFLARGRAITALCNAAKSQWPRLRQWTYGPHVLKKAYEAGAPFVRLPWCFFHGRWCDGALTDGALQRDDPWPQHMLQDAWGLHLHGSGSNGKPVFNGSILGVYERTMHAALLDKLRAAEAAGPQAGLEVQGLAPGLSRRPSPGTADTWASERKSVMLFPPSSTADWTQSY